MKRKKTEEPTPDPKLFWPIPGVDGEPYPPLVQEALDLVEKETLRRKRATCTHEHRIFISSTRERSSGGVAYKRACRDCHLVVGCEHPLNARNRLETRYSGGTTVEMWECRCGKLLFQKNKPTPRTTPVYGLPYERQDPPRQTGTAWLKTQEQEHREHRTDRHLSRQIQRVSAWNREVQRVQKLLKEAERFSEGELARSSEAYILRKANGDVVLQVTNEGEWGPNLDWVRTMNGRTRM